MVAHKLNKIIIEKFEDHSTMAEIRVILFAILFL